MLTDKEKMDETRKHYEVPIAQKANLTLREATAHFNIGEKKIKEPTDGRNCRMYCFVAPKGL